MGFSKRAPLFLLEFSENYQINLSRTFWSNCSRMSGFFVFQKGGRKNGTVIKKGTGIAPSCCKRELPRNGGGMPLRLKRQREKYVADPNSVSGALSRLPALFAGAAERIVCGHDI